MAPPRLDYNSRLILALAGRYVVLPVSQCAVVSVKRQKKVCGEKGKKNLRSVLYQCGLWLGGEDEGADEKTTSRGMESYREREKLRGNEDENVSR